MNWNFCWIFVVAVVGGGDCEVVFIMWNDVLADQATDVL